VTLHKSLFRGDDPADETKDLVEAETQRMRALPPLRPPTAQEPDDVPASGDEPGQDTGGSRRRRILTIGGVSLAALAIIALGVALTLSIMHTASVRDDYRQDIANMQSEHSEALISLAAEDARHEARAVSNAVAKQKRTDRRAMRRAVRAERRKAAKQIAAARSQGYSAGSSDGYSQGSAAGYDRGLTAGSDDLTCSDDPDVTWLPYCP